MQNSITRLAFGCLTLLLLLTASCAPAAPQEEEAAPAEEEEEEEIGEPEEDIEPEEPVIYLSNLAFELQHQILQGHLGDFLEKYPIKLESADDEDSWIHELHFKGDGQRYMVSIVPANNLHQARINLENAYSLLDKGKLADETESQALDKDEVAREMENAIGLLSEQQLLMPSIEQDCIQWVKECEFASINNEKTVVKIIETHDDYEQRLSRILTLLARILSDLPEAVEG